MTKNEKVNTRTFSIDLFIVHESMEPDEITKTLGLKPKNVMRVGDRRKDSKGDLLKGTYSDSRWRYSKKFRVKDQCFAEAITKFCAQLEKFESLFHHIRATGGKTCLIISFYGDGYFGDQIGHDCLATLSRLQIDFGIESFAVPQS